MRRASMMRCNMEFQKIRQRRKAAFAVSPFRLERSDAEGALRSTEEDVVGSGARTASSGIGVSDDESASSDSSVAPFEGGEDGMGGGGLVGLGGSTCSCAVSTLGGVSGSPKGLISRGGRGGGVGVTPASTGVVGSSWVV